MTSEDSIIVVSGLPRSGTSLMMQILQAGGIPLLTDEHRVADKDNPRGYFEYERVKWLPADSTWLGLACGKAIKVIAQLTPFLPRGFRYQILFMERDLDEVLQSQSTMVGVESQSIDLKAELRSAFIRQTKLAREYLLALPQSKLETIEHHTLLSAPGTVIDRICKFVDQTNLDKVAMLAAIETDLYRTRIRRSTTQS